MIQKIKCSIEPVILITDFNTNLKEYLSNEAKKHGLRWLLAHAYDGVIWGEERDDELYLSSCLIEPDLRIVTLQMARLFGEKGELFIWQTDNGWKARIVKDGEGTVTDYYDEPQFLWGTDVEKNDGNFILLRHGSEGLRHAPPFKSLNTKKLRLQLNVRHYINYDQDGQAYVDFSRLVSIGAFNDKGVI